MKIVGVIPARFNSSRFPGKPLALIMDKPMIWWVYQNAAKVPEFSDVIVATDDRRIMDVCAGFGMKAVMTSDRHKTGTDRLCEVSEKIPADIYVNVQGDEPLIRAETIRKAIEPFLREEPNVYVTNLMSRIRRNSELLSANVVKVAWNERQEAVYFSRSPVPYPKSGKEPVYYKQMGIYAFASSAVRFFMTSPPGPLEQAEEVELLRFVENRKPVQMIEVEDDTVAVDVPADLERVRRHLARQVVK